MELDLARAVTALLDPLALLTILGALAFLYALWRVITDDVDIRGGDRP